MKNKVFVSGCFDILHSGHIAFLQEAAQYGNLYVGIGSDTTIQTLKHHKPTLSEQERLVIVQSIKYVYKAFINQGNGYIDFLQELTELQPQYFVVNEDGHSKEKEELCAKLNIQYIVLKRTPYSTLEPTSSTKIKQYVGPYRIDLAGGGLDTSLSSIFPGSVITICIEPNYDFKTRCGMATSTRSIAQEFFPLGSQHNAETMSKILYSLENGPLIKGTAGPQDSIGMCYDGVVNHFYGIDAGPTIISTTDHTDFLEQHIGLIETTPRSKDYNPYFNNDINASDVMRLSSASSKCGNAILNEDLQELATSINDTGFAQTNLFPSMSTDTIENIKQIYPDILAYKYCGAGGGGYIIGVFETLPENIIHIKIKK